MNRHGRDELWSQLLDRDFTHEELNVLKRLEHKRGISCYEQYKLLHKRFRVFSYKYPPRECRRNSASINRSISVNGIPNRSRRSSIGSSFILGGEPSLPSNVLSRVLITAETSILEHALANLVLTGNLTFNFDDMVRDAMVMVPGDLFYYKTWEMRSQCQDKPKQRVMLLGNTKQNLNSMPDVVISAFDIGDKDNHLNTANMRLLGKSWRSSLSDAQAHLENAMFVFEKAGEASTEYHNVQPALVLVALPRTADVVENQNLRSELSSFCYLNNIKYVQVNKNCPGESAIEIMRFIVQSSIANKNFRQRKQNQMNNGGSVLVMPETLRNVDVYIKECIPCKLM